MSLLARAADSSCVPLGVCSFKIDYVAHSTQCNCYIPCLGLVSASLAQRLSSLQVALPPEQLLQLSGGYLLGGGGWRWLGVCYHCLRNLLYEGEGPEDETGANNIPCKTQEESAASF